MEVEKDKVQRSLSFVVLIVGLLVIIAGLGCLAAAAMSEAGHAKGDEHRKGLMHLAWLALVLLLPALGLLVMVVGRRLRQVLIRPAEPRPTPHVDAWAEAGRRFKLPEEEQKGDGDGDGDP
jgi:hypothetical protein